MIRINLLTVEKAAQKSAGFTLPTVSDKGGQLAAVLILVGCAGYVGWDYYGLQQADSRLQTQLAAARAEKARLQPILAELERFESRKRELQQRVTLIEELRRNQVGPVHLLDQISRSLPDRLWLENLKQTGDDVQLDGKTSSLTALADFVANLENTHYFMRPVEILSSEEEKQGDTDLVKFSVKATFAMPGQAKPTPPVAAGAAAARRLAQ